LFAATVILFLIAVILYASTITSRIINNTVIQNGIAPSYVKHISTVLTRTLSAIGSQIFPNSDTQLYFLAKYPSNKSVIEAITNNAPAAINVGVNP
jgi:hypothetical protein